VPSVSDAELDVMKVLWSGGPGTVREVETRLSKRRRRWAYNTVLTLLSRLREKGFVDADKSGAAHVFKSVVSREQLLRRGLMELADRVCDGTASPLLHALLEGSQLTPKDIAELRKMLDQMESNE
jgi:predicted transcriptional regulator